MAEPVIPIVHAKVSKFRFTVTSLVTGTAINSAAWDQFWFAVKATLVDVDADAVILKTLGSGIVPIDATIGLYEVTIEPADTADLTNAYTTYQGAIQGRDGSAEPWQLWEGTVLMRPSGVVSS